MKQHNLKIIHDRQAGRRLSYARPFHRPVGPKVARRSLV
jgi:hypothetical protein